MVFFIFSQNSVFVLSSLVLPLERYYRYHSKHPVYCTYLVVSWCKETDTVAIYTRRAISSTTKAP